MEKSRNQHLPLIPLFSELPFMFGPKPIDYGTLSTTSSLVQITTDQVFINELSKIGISISNIQSINPAKEPKKSAFSPSISPQGRFPYQRNSRNISPPKENLMLIDRKNPLYISKNSAIILDSLLQGNISQQDKIVDDNDLIALKKQYLELIEINSGIGLKSELIYNDDEVSGIEEFNEWEISIMKKMQLH